MNNELTPLEPVRLRLLVFRPFVIRNPARMGAAVAGALDVSVSASYFFGIDVAWWYTLTLILKLGLVALLRIPGRSTILFHLPALSAMTILLVASCWLGNAVVVVWMTAFGFIVHLSLTLAVLRGDVVNVYLRSVAYSGAVVAITYDLAAISGAIEVVYGRHLFFGGSHPNLGSEIVAMAAVAACMSLGHRRFLLVALPALLAAGLMQGRSALLVILLTIAVRSYQLVDAQRRLVMFCVGVLGLIALLSEAVRGWLTTMVGTVFLTDDPYRGIGTGFVGRSDRWQVAWNAFIDKPLFGQGFGYYESTGIESAHNFYMYALVEFGLLSLPIFMYAIWCLRRMVNSLPPQMFVSFLPILILTVLNDRFINLNPYPLVMIVTVLAAGASNRFSHHVSNKT